SSRSPWTLLPSLALGRRVADYSGHVGVGDVSTSRSSARERIGSSYAAQHLPDEAPNRRYAQGTRHEKAPPAYFLCPYFRDHLGDRSLLCAVSRPGDRRVRADLAVQPALLPCRLCSQSVGDRPDCVCGRQRGTARSAKPTVPVACWSPV